MRRRIHGLEKGTVAVSVVFRSIPRCRRPGRQRRWSWRERVSRVVYRDAGTFGISVPSLDLTRRNVKLKPLIRVEVASIDTREALKRSPVPRATPLSTSSVVVLNVPARTRAIHPVNVSTGRSLTDGKHLGRAAVDAGSEPQRTTGTNHTQGWILFESQRELGSTEARDGNPRRGRRIGAVICSIV